MARPPRLSPLATGFAGAAAMLPVELHALGWPGLRLALVVAGLYAGLGLAIGGALWVGELLARRTERPFRRALGRAAPSLLALVPLSLHLFDGGFAATLPGARVGPVLVPAATALGIAGAVWLAEKIARPRAVAAALAATAGACLLADHRLYVKGYGDLHLLLAVAACSSAGLALQGALRRDSPARPAPRWRAPAIALAVLALLALDLRYGLARADDRWTVALHWSTTRRLVKAARLSDRDRDGYSALLGGPDCDDRDPQVHPLAVEIPGNAVDEDCDGVAAQVGPPPLPSPRHDPLPPGTLERLAGADVIVLCVDGLRADLLADTAEDRRDFPHLFQITDGGRRFRRAFATSSSTFISLPSMLSGRVDPFQRVPRTLAEVMRDSGRATHAVLPREVPRWVGEAAATRGLDGWDATSGGSGLAGHGDAATSSRATELALAFFDAHPGPSYLWLHLFDVHEHNEIADGDPALAEVTGGARLGRRQKYRALLGVVDRALGRFAAALAARGRWQRALVVLVADHGEGLGEEPRLPDEHNEYVYQPLVQVPLAIRGPGIAPGDEDEPVSIIDLLPTLAELVGQPVGEHADGASLAPALYGRAMPGPRPLWMSDAAQYALVDWPWKLLVRPNDHLLELYDLSRDPGERDDRSAARPDLVTRLNQTYRLRPPFPVDQSPRARRAREAALAAPR